MNRRSKMAVFSAAVAAIGPISATRAGSLLTEPFTYSDGALETVSGGAWAINSGTGSKSVASGKLVIDDVNTSDYQRQYDTSQTSSSGTIFASFKVTFASTDAPSSAGTYFAAFSGPQTVTTAGTSFSTFFRGRVGSFVAGTEGAGKFTLGISDAGASANTFTAWGTALSFDTEYTIVEEYDWATATNTLWVNPTGVTSTSVTAAGATATGSFGSFLWRVSSSTVDGDKTVDDLNVGTTFSDVLQVPEPSVAALLAIGSVTSMLRRRRRA